jgi:hypothetical protein
MELVLWLWGRIMFLNMLKGHPRVVEGAIWYVPEILRVQKQMKVRLLHC